MNHNTDKVFNKVDTNKSPPPRPPKLKLDLSAIANHPLVQNRSPDVAKDIEQSVLRSRTNSQVISKAHQMDNNSKRVEGSVLRTSVSALYNRNSLNSSINNNNNNTDPNNNPDDAKRAVANNNNNSLRIRRSTSMSYTSTLRKRRLHSPGGGADNGVQDVEFPSPMPNVKLPNFSISPYSDRAQSRRLSSKEGKTEG